MPTQFKPADYLTGRLRLPPWFNDLMQKPYQYSGQLSVANNGQGLLQMQIQSDSYFLAESLTIIPKVIGAYEAMTVQITDTTVAQPWSNLPINLRDIAGRGDNPMYFSVPNLLRPSSTVNFQLANSQGSTQQFYVVLGGRKVYGLSDDQVAFLTRRMWFQYKLVLPAIASGVTGAIASVNVFNESDFMCKFLYSTTGIQFAVNTASAGSVSSELMMNLRDNTSDNSFFSAQTPLRAVCGSKWSAYLAGGASFNNGNGYKLIRPMLIRRNGQVQGTFDNLSGTSLEANTVSVVLDGVRIFDPQ